jgi:hypothetical protein
VFVARREPAGVDTGNNGRGDIRVKKDRIAGVRIRGILKTARNMEDETWKLEQDRDPVVLYSFLFI